VTRLLPALLLLVSAVGVSAESVVDRNLKTISEVNLGFDEFQQFIEKS
jgi:hypothetical protein